MFNIPIHSQHVMIAIIAVLLVATFSYLWLSRRHSDKDYLELKLRIRSWWWMIAIQGLEGNDLKGKLND